MTPDAAIAKVFLGQARACADLGSPFMEQLCTVLATQSWPAGVIRDRVFSWEGDISPAGASVPLRLAGALHALHLQGHAKLNAVYPPHVVSDTNLWAAVSDVLTSEAAHIDAWLDSAPQTNEVRRSAPLIAAGHLLHDRFGLPIDMIELGASAGLNLNWDKFGLQIGDAYFGPEAPALTFTPAWDGALPPKAAPTIASRKAVDLNPLDPVQDALRLRAYLWADQPHRLALTDAAIAVQTTPVAKSDAIDWLAQNLAPRSGHLQLIYHTVAWQYFPMDKQIAGTAMIKAAGARATYDAPLALLEMENIRDGQGAALTLTLWPDNVTIMLGRADFHGRWVKWSPEQIGG